MSLQVQLKECMDRMLAKGEVVTFQAALELAIAEYNRAVATEAIAAHKARYAR